MKTRREFLVTTLAVTALLTNGSGQTAAVLAVLPTADELGRKSPLSDNATSGGQGMADKAEDPRIRRARLAGPEQVTKNETVAEIAGDGPMTVLVKETNEGFCTPGDEDKIGAPPMCMNPMGMTWMM